MKKMKLMTIKPMALWMMMLTMAMATLSSCDKDDDDDMGNYTGKMETYTLAPVSSPAISGKVTFKEMKDKTTEVTIELMGASAGGSHPAHIHAGATGDMGAVVVPLNNVEGATGKSVTVVSKLDGKAITYDQLIAYNGYVNVHKSAAELAVLIASGDIGNSVIKGTPKEITMAAVGMSGVMGKARLAERKSGSTVVMITLTGTMANMEHPAHIHKADGTILVGLNSVNGSTGMSVTNLASTYKYSDILAGTNYINVHKSAAELAVIVSRGDLK